MFAHSGHVMTLANSIIGVGILAMPFCFQKCGIILAILLLIVSNWITRICCHYLIKMSLLTRRKSFEFLGFHAFGSSGKLLVELCIIGYLIGTCITYFVVIGDLGPQIVTKMFNLNEPHRHLRTLIMFIVTLVCILPLGMLKNVDSLSTICTASIGFYVCLVLKIILESGTHIMADDWMDKVVYWEPAGVLQCLPIISMALSCQMQIFEVFSTINNQSLEKLNGIVRNAIWICTGVYIAVGFFGYVAFCTQKFSGNILVNMAPSFGSDVIKIGFVLSVAFSFPLVIFPCRASIYSLLYRKGHTDNSAYIPESRFKMITVFIVGFALCVALMIPSVELIIGLVGSTIGVAICVMFPAASFRKIILKNTTERNLAQMVLVSGFCLMILGTYANLNAIDEKSSGTHMNEPSQLKDYPVKLPEMPDIKESYKVDEEQHKEKLRENEVKLELKLMTLEQQEKKKLEREREEKLQKAKEHAFKQLNKPKLDLAAKTLKEQQKSIQIESKVDTPIDKPQTPIKNNETLKTPEQADQVKVQKEPPMPSTQQQQTIDKDALKANEEIAAEEQKAVANADAELKETKQELKQTKELFERTVDELKEELAKQNKETQNLVVEKINKMVEKVEKIEEKLEEKERENQKESKLDNVQPAAKETSNLTEAKPKEQQQQAEVKPVLANNEPAAKPVKPDEVKPEEPPLRAEEVEAHAGVYEPQSYKAGERLAHDKNAESEKADKQLPPPLALLYNASQAKLKETNETKQEAPALAPAPKLVAYEPSSQTQPPSPVPPLAPVKNQPEAQAATDRANIEAIRRDLLQVDTKEMLPATDNSTGDLDAKSRAKRHASKQQNLQEQICKVNCLTEPKLDYMLQQSVGGAVVGLQGQITGRNLKSLKQQEEQSDTTNEDVRE